MESHIHCNNCHKAIDVADIEGVPMHGMTIARAFMVENQIEFRPYNVPVCDDCFQHAKDTEKKSRLVVVNRKTM